MARLARERGGNAPLNDKGGDQRQRRIHNGTNGKGHAYAGQEHAYGDTLRYPIETPELIEARAALTEAKARLEKQNTPLAKASLEVLQMQNREAKAQHESNDRLGIGAKFNPLMQGRK